MKYTTPSIKYVLKNFQYIFPFAILPAFFLALSLDPSSINALLKAMTSGTTESLSFSVIFHAVSIFNFSSGGAFFAGLCGFILLIVCISMMMALIEKHMRIGKRTYNGIFSKLNDNLLSTAAMSCLFAVVYELWTMITAAILFLLFHVGNKIAVLILSAFAFMALQIVLLYVLSLFYLWLPCLQITGFKAFEALKYSYQLVAPVKGKIVLGQTVSLTLAEILICLCSYLFEGWILVTVAAALYACMVLLYCVRMQITYFARAQMERADLKKYYNV